MSSGYRDSEISTITFISKIPPQVGKSSNFERKGKGSQNLSSNIRIATNLYYENKFFALFDFMLAMLGSFLDN